jgi:hypothetical protein
MGSDRLYINGIGCSLNALIDFFLTFSLQQEGSLSVNLKQVTVKTWLNSKCEEKWPGEISQK